MFETVTENLKKLGYGVSCFPTAQEACRYLDGQIDGTTVGIGGSMTVEEMGLYDCLASHNDVYWHWKADPAGNQETLKKAGQAEVYLTSANGLAQTGEIINIDGNGNRVAAMLYGHARVYIIVGKNKIAPDYDGALYRARNVAAPKNAGRIGAKTPCAVNCDRCYDCDSPDRICKGLAVLWGPMRVGTFEVVLIDEDLGY